MTPKDLVVFLESEQDIKHRLGYAMTLAKHWRAHLIATFVTRSLALTPYAGFAVADGLSEMLSVNREQNALAAANARAEFERLTHDRSFTSEWRESNDASGEELMLHARHARLAILGPPSLQASDETVLGLSEQMLFASGRPCLLLPRAWDPERLPARVIVGWNGGREATRAISDALPILRAAEAVHLVVAADTHARLLNGEDPGADMAAHLARQGVRVVLEQSPVADAGDVLLDRCATLDADLLVMGAMGRARVSEFIFGGATRTVFRSSNVPLLVSN